MTFYEAWKTVFAYASQPTVIDVACDITVGEELPDPTYCGKPLQSCEHDNPCGSLGDHDDHVK